MIYFSVMTSGDIAVQFYHKNYHNRVAQQGGISVAQRSLGGNFLLVQGLKLLVLMHEST